MTGAITMGNAIGPGLSGVVLALHLPAGFIALQLACCVAATGLAIRLGRRGDLLADHQARRSIQACESGAVPV